MAMMTRFLIASITAAGITTAALAGPERITFSSDYRDNFVQYYAGERANGKQYAIIFANPVAAKAAEGSGTLPIGSQIVMEIYKPQRNANEVVFRDANDALIPGELAAIAVMESQAGWGEAYDDELRNRDWDFGLFTPSGEIKKNDSTACLECHVGYGDSAHMHTYDALVENAAE